MHESSNPPTDLRSVLADFETNLETPIISGDLAAWVEELQEVWTGASAQIDDHIRQRHPKQYEEMAKQDPELLPRIELLKAEDEAIETQRQQIAHAIDRMAQHAPKLEPDEEKAQKLVETLIDDATAFLTRVRKHEVALQAWYVEAFDRDSGAVD